MAASRSESQRVDICPIPREDEDADVAGLGEKHFMENFIDGDLAANNGGWQWTASVSRLTGICVELTHRPVDRNRSSALFRE